MSDNEGTYHHLQLVSAYCVNIILTLLNSFVALETIQDHLLTQGQNAISSEEQNSKSISDTDSNNFLKIDKKGFDLQALNHFSELFGLLTRQRSN